MSHLKSTERAPWAFLMEGLICDEVSRNRRSPRFAQLLAEYHPSDVSWTPPPASAKQNICLRAC